MKILFAAAAAALCLTRPAVAQEGTPQASRQIGEWRATRVVGANGRAVRCDGERSSPAGLIRFSAIPAREGGYTYRFTFSGAPGQIDGLGASFPVRYWVDDEATGKDTTATVGPAGYASFTEGNDEPGSTDALRNGRTFFIRAGQIQLNYPLRGSLPLFNFLHECADKP
ncbi:hypothetical protein EOD42_23080 [Rhodovarius crocodyli]|uniref:Uncharacterized protein n=1 Tax=Rhodovarius crocodyli TaxID=1979269 RepID=A0A437LZ31_9PROT|nr:hypothetical protein [Rhodovarius crocodyli]RVT90689.1 hypothetical protein EOD42_23080 [Rhodovarius crocodyli]